MKRSIYLSVFVLALFLIFITYSKWLLSKTDFKILTYTVKFDGDAQSIEYLPNSLKQGFLFLRGGSIDKYIVPLTNEKLSQKGYKIHIPESGEYELIEAFDSEVKSHRDDKARLIDGSWLPIGKLGLKRSDIYYNLNCCRPNNLIKNGSFEHGLWEGAGHTVLSSDSLEGTRSAEIVSDEDSVASINLDVPQVAGGKYYDVSFYSKNVAGNELQFLITEVHNDGNVNEISKSIDSFYNWENYNFFFKTRPQTRSVKISFKSPKKGGRRVINLIDDVRFIEKYRPEALLLKNVEIGEKSVAKPVILNLFLFSLVRTSFNDKDRFIVVEGPQSTYWRAFNLDSFSYVQNVSNDFTFGKGVWEIGASNRDQTYLFINLVGILLLLVCILPFMALKIINFYHYEIIFKKFKSLIPRYCTLFYSAVEAKKDNLIIFFLLDILIVTVYLANFIPPVFTGTLLAFVSLSLFYYLIRPPIKIYLCLGVCLTEIGFLIAILNKSSLLLRLFGSEYRLMVTANHLVYFGVFNLFILSLNLFLNEYFKKSEHQ